MIFTVLHNNLITINYPHGYHGDLIACLITNTRPNLSKSLTATYTTPGIISAFGVKNLDIIVGMHDSQKNRDFFFSQDTKFAKRQCYYYIQLQGEDFRENLSDNLRHQFSHLYDKKTVFNTHYCNHQNFLPLQEIFPGSLNVFLTLENKNNKPLYDFLFEYKILKYYKNTSAYEFFKDNLHSEPHETETPVYVDRLMTEDGLKYAKELESLFDCNFDAKLLNRYKLMNEQLLMNNGYVYENLDHW